MVAEETLVSKEAPFKESAWDHHLNSLLEDLHSIGTPRDGRALEPNVKHTTNEYISPDNRTHTRTERYEYNSGLPYENGSNQKVVQHSSMMYRSSRHSDSRSDSRSSSLKKVPALSRSESLNRSESLRRRARDPSPDLRLTMHDDIQYATPPPPLPTQRLKQNIVELDSLLHDLNTSRSETAKPVEKSRGSSISFGVTSEGTQTETPKSSITELRSQAMMDPISHSTPNQQRKQISTYSSSSEYYQDGFQSAHLPAPPTSSYKSYSTEHLQPVQPTSSRAYSSEHISSHRDASPIPPPATDSDSDPHAKTIVKNYHYYYTVDGTLKPGAPPSAYPPPDTPHTSSTTATDTKSYHYNYVVGPDGQPVPGSQPPHGTYHPPHSKPQSPDDPESSKTVVTHRAYNYSWSSQGPPAADGHPSPDKPDRYYIVEDGRPNEPYTRHPHTGKRPSDKPKPFPVSPQDERPNSGINYPAESHSYHYTWDSRRDPTSPHSGPPYHTLPGKRDSSPSPHNTATTINSYNYSWSYPGQPESPGLHPTPPTQPADTKPPKRLDDLMASFSDIEDAPPTPPMQEKKPHRIELAPANVPAIHVSASAEAAAKADAETAPLVEKKTVTIEKSINKTGSPVYYPPSYSDPKPLQETPKPTPMWRMEMEKEKMKGKYKYRESESKSEFKAIPLCLPLCCAAPLCCEIM